MAPKNKINRILHQAAKVVLGKEAIGRTYKWMLAKMNWFDVNTNYENSMQNEIFKILNSENQHDFKIYLTKNRNIRMYSENKVGTHDQDMGHSAHTQKSFLYRAINIFNKLPKNVTLSPNANIFKI